MPWGHIRRLGFRPRRARTAAQRRPPGGKAASSGSDVGPAGLPSRARVAASESFRLDQSESPPRLTGPVLEIHCRSDPAPTIAAGRTGPGGFARRSPSLSVSPGAPPFGRGGQIQRRRHE